MLLPTRPSPQSGSLVYGDLLVTHELCTVDLHALSSSRLFSILNKSDSFPLLSAERLACFLSPHADT